MSATPLASPALNARAATLELIPHWIGGQALAGTGARLAVLDPASGAALREIALGGAEEVGAAVAAALAAWRGWADTPPLRRARVLASFLALLNEQRDALARLITSEHGKVFSDAQGEVSRGIEIVEFACGIPQLLKGDFTPGGVCDPSARRGARWARHRDGDCARCGREDFRYRECAGACPPPRARAGGARRGGGRR